MVAIAMHAGASVTEATQECKTTPLLEEEGGGALVEVGNNRADIEQKTTKHREEAMCDSRDRFEEGGDRNNVNGIAS